MELNEYIIKFIRTIRGFDGLKFFSEGASLSKTEFRLLQEVVNEEEKGRSIISSELSRRLGVTRSAVSQIVTKLEKRNIVKRVSSPTDKKIAYIRLSETASALFEEECKRANCAMERVVAELGKDKLDDLIDRCEEIISALKRAGEEIDGQDPQERPRIG